MIIHNDIKGFCNAVSKATGIAARVIWAWMIAENGAQREAIDPDNNPLNIRYTGKLRPQETGWVYLKNTTGIKANGVVVYPTPADGIAATIAVISEHYYEQVRKIASDSPTDYEAQAQAIQDSLWDADHYFQTNEPPGHIISVLRSMGDTDFSETITTPPMSSAPVEHVYINDGNEAKAQAAVKVSLAFTDLWNTLDSQASRDFVHYQLMSLRSYLASHGVGSVNADGRLIYKGATQEYNI